MYNANRVYNTFAKFVFGPENTQAIPDQDPGPPRAIVPPELPQAEQAMANYEEIEEINVSEEVYQKKKVLKDNARLIQPFAEIVGESSLYLGATTDGVICLSDYRLFVSVNPLFNIPLGLIEQVDFRENHHLYIHCKNAQTFRCTFSESSDCQKWQLRIQAALMPISNLDKCFSCVFFSWNRDESEKCNNNIHEKCLGPPFLVPITELEMIRMNFGKTWRMTMVNSDFSLCDSYPQRLIVPANISDEMLREASASRYCKRIPVVVWRHQRNGCVIARSSQPKVGFFGSPCKHDEELITAILDASREDCGPDQRPVHHDLRCLQTDIVDESYRQNHCVEEDIPKILVVDARSYAAVFGNRAKGGGTEVSYPNCEVVYQNLTNIHGVRRSLHALRSLCAMPPDPSLWLSSLEATKWLSMISSLISAATQVVTALDIDNRDVLVHCSDGWDRTPQIVALAELLMDPFYRTKEGFRVLVEKEWLEFGHKFGDRCGNYPAAEDLNERSPIFLQWLDCVYQIQHQYQIYFEFNEQYLVKLMYHTYSGLFGTFLCNTEKQRMGHSVRERTYCIWHHLNRSPYFHNHLYEESLEVLKPSFQPNFLKFWDSVYFLSSLLSTGKPESPVCADNKPTNIVPEASASLSKTKSYDDLSFGMHPHGKQRRSSDTGLELPSIVKDPKSSNGNLPGQSKDSNQPGDEETNGKVNPNRTSNSVEEDCCSKESLPLHGANALVSEKPQSSAMCKASNASSENEEFKASSANNEPKNSFLSDYFHKKLVPSGSSSASATPCHSRSSSGVPSSPCDEFVGYLSNGTVPQHITDIDGSAIIGNEVQLQAWRQINLRNERIRQLEKQLEIHNQFRSWLMNHEEEFKQWAAEVHQRDKEEIPEDPQYFIEDLQIEEPEVQNSLGSDDSFVKIDHNDIAAAVAVDSHLERLCCNLKPGARRNLEMMCQCFHYPSPSESGKESRKVSIPNSEMFSHLRRQCRQSVESRNKLPDTVITATSN